MSTVSSINVAMDRNVLLFMGLLSDFTRIKIQTKHVRSPGNSTILILDLYYGVKKTDKALADSRKGNM